MRLRILPARAAGRAWISLERVPVLLEERRCIILIAPVVEERDPLVEHKLRQWYFRLLPPLPLLLVVVAVLLPFGLQCLPSCVSASALTGEGVTGDFRAVRTGRSLGAGADPQLRHAGRGLGASGSIRANS